MDILKFYDFTRSEHVVCNPTSEDKLSHLVELLHLPTNAMVVDIACGKGEFLIRLASCIGASWVFGGHAATLEALTRMVKTGAWVIVGEPYWLQEPFQEYLEASDVAR
jgi:ubiquinone/menaquinone biosynthesis C-methylase UbiE